MCFLKSGKSIDRNILYPYLYPHLTCTGAYSQITIYSMPSTPVL